MKKNLIHQILFLCCVGGCALSMFIASSCESKSDAQVYDPNAPVKVTNFYPDSGGVATQVILNGSNFGTDLSKIQVLFNNKEAAVIGSLGDKLYVITPRRPGDGMPDDGDPDHDKVEITVRVGEQSAVYEQKFDYRIQTVVTTLCGRPGTSDTKVGTLSETEFNHQVAFLAIDAEDNLFVCPREDGNHNKLVLVNEKENTSSILLDNAPALNQPCVVDNGRGLVIPTDYGNTYFSVNSSDFWTPRRRDFIPAEGENASEINTIWKHSFAYCELDGYFYCRSKDKNFFLRIEEKTGNAWAVKVGNNELLSTSDCFMTFSRKDPRKLYMAFTNAHCIGVFEDITNPTRDGNFRIYAGIKGRGGHADGLSTEAQFNEPRQLVVDEEDNLYIADSNNYCIRKVTPEGVVSTVIGNPNKSGYRDGTPDVALFSQPWGLAINSEGVIFIGDNSNLCVRKLSIE